MTPKLIQDESLILLKVNPGPNLDSSQNFTICHWNLNSIAAHLTIHKTNILCLSETYQPTNSKHGGVFIYYKRFLPLKIIGIQYLQKCINFHLIIGDKLCHFITLYRSHDEFNSFIKNLELNLDKATTFNPFFVVVLGDFIAK